MGKYVTVAPQSDTSLEFPTPAYLIANDMTLEFRNDGNRTWENETAGTLHPYLYLAYSSYPIDYPPNEPATANTYYSIGANRDSDAYNAHAHQDGPAVFRIYADECPFPPSAPPPPPTVAMCHEGYWPLYMTEAEAVALSPMGTAQHAHHQGRRLLHARRLRRRAARRERCHVVPVALQDAATLPAALALPAAEPAAAHVPACLAAAVPSARAAASGLPHHRRGADPVRRGACASRGTCGTAARRPSRWRSGSRRSSARSSSSDARVYACVCVCARAARVWGWVLQTENISVTTRSQRYPREGRLQRPARWCVHHLHHLGHRLGVQRPLVRLAILLGAAHVPAGDDQHDAAGHDHAGDDQEDGAGVDRRGSQEQARARCTRGPRCPHCSCGAAPTPYP